MVQHDLSTTSESTNGGVKTLTALLHAGFISKSDLIYILYQYQSEISCDTIDTGEASAKTEEMKLSIMKEEVSKVHHRKITLAKDGRWTTYVPDKEAKNGLRKIRSNSELTFYEKLLKFYNLSEPVKSDPSMADLYDSWRAERIRTVAAGTVQKDDSVWRQIRDKKVVKIPVKDLLPGDLLDLLLETKPTKRQYQAQKGLITHILAYAVRQRIIDRNPALELHGMVSGTAFLPEEEKPDEEVTFWADDREKVINELERMFEVTKNTAYLGCELNFYLGLRAGELSCLQVNDFDFERHILTLSRSEVVTYAADCKSKTGVAVSDHLKKGKKRRTLPVGDTVRELVNRIRAQNASDGFVSEWLFITDHGSRKKSEAFSAALRRVNRHLGISQRSIHAIRKTVISELGESGVLSGEELKRFAGHNDITTTDRYYIRAVSDFGDKADAVESVLAKKT